MKTKNSSNRRFLHLAPGVLCALAVCFSPSARAQLIDEFSVPRAVVVAAQNIGPAAGGPVTNTVDCVYFQGTAKLDIFVFTNLVTSVTNYHLPLTITTNATVAVSKTITTNSIIALADGCYTNTTITNAITITTNISTVDAITITTNISIGTNYTLALGGGTLTATILFSDDQTNQSDLANIAIISSPTAIYYTNYYFAGTNLVITNNFLLPGTITTPVAATAGFATPFLASLPFTNSGAITLSPGCSEFAVHLGSAKRYLHLILTPGGTVTNWTVCAILTTPTR